MPINLFFQLRWLSQIKMMHNLNAAANKTYCLERIDLSWKKIYLCTNNNINEPFWYRKMKSYKFVVIDYVRDHLSSNYVFHVFFIDSIIYKLNKNIFHLNVISIVCLFVCWFGVFRPTRKVFTPLETSPLPVMGCKFWRMFGMYGYLAVRVL